MFLNAYDKHKPTPDQACPLGGPETPISADLCEITGYPPYLPAKFYLEEKSVLEIWR